MANKPTPFEIRIPLPFLYISFYVGLVAKDVFEISLLVVIPNVWRTCATFTTGRPKKKEKRPVHHPPIMFVKRYDKDDEY